MNQTGKKVIENEVQHSMWTATRWKWNSRISTEIVMITIETGVKEMIEILSTFGFGNSEIFRKHFWLTNSVIDDQMKSLVRNWNRNSHSIPCATHRNDSINWYRVLLLRLLTSEISLKVFISDNKSNLMEELLLQPHNYMQFKTTETRSHVNIPL